MCNCVYGISIGVVVGTRTYWPKTAPIVCCCCATDTYVRDFLTRIDNQLLNNVDPIALLEEMHAVCDLGAGHDAMRRRPEQGGGDRFASRPELTQIMNYNLN